MTDQSQKQLGRTLWAVADQLRGAMNADDFRDYMLAFLFLRYLSDNYEQAAKRELGRDFPVPSAIGNGGRPDASKRRLEANVSIRPAVFQSRRLLASNLIIGAPGRAPSLCMGLFSLSRTPAEW